MLTEHRLCAQACVQKDTEWNKALFNSLVQILVL